MVTSVEENATEAGKKVLASGGNAVDAAVAVAYALAVTHPSAGNLGGGGFMMIRLASGEIHAVDFREIAPSSASTAGILKMIKDTDGYGYASIAVPGTVAGLSYARDRWGTRPLADLIGPALDLAKKGHRLGSRQGAVLGWAWPRLKGNAEARRVFGKGKRPVATGDLIKQPDLARTLQEIADKGPREFYDGAIATKIANSMKAHGGLITTDDLRAYQAIERDPLHFRYRGFDVYTMPPPSMGGVAFADIMLTLEQLKAYEAPPRSAQALHDFIEASRRAYSERRQVGGDPSFNDPSMMLHDLPRLLDRGRIAERSPSVDRQQATPSSAIPVTLAKAPHESEQTTHFSVVDGEGNAVSCTYTLSASYGSKVVLDGLGVVANNALGAFSTSGVNEVAPHKRMASSMTPTIVTQDGKLVLVLGSPGGDTIPNTVAQVFRNLVDWNMTIDAAVSEGRLHEQWLPDKVRVERLKPPSRKVLAELRKRGHTIDLDPMPIGDANNILVGPDGVAYGAADLREGGQASAVKRPKAAPASASKN